jgi:hypothetical protein
MFFVRCQYKHCTTLYFSEGKVTEADKATTNTTLVPSVFVYGKVTTDFVSFLKKALYSNLLLTP